MFRFGALSFHSLGDDEENHKTLSHINQSVGLDLSLDLPDTKQEVLEVV
jgi:hypothetical protein